MATELDTAPRPASVPAEAVRPADAAPADLDGDVAGSRGGAYFAVTESCWDDLLPQLPPEVTDLLAPPVAVSAVLVSQG